MKVVLISTYELGHQPFGLASPAAWLRAEGADVTAVDLAVQKLADFLPVIKEAALIAFYLPMHTATRLASSLIPRLQRLNGEAHLCAYGLYAPINEPYLRHLGIRTIVGGEFEGGLVQLYRNLVDGQRSAIPPISMARQQFKVPDRSGLPALTHYSYVDVNGERRRAGYTEATRGCKHQCRHCPIVPVYNGRFHVIQADIVLADIRQQVAAGARHITFGDPDFLNGPGHALRIVQALHHEFPSLTYDVTIKVEHLLKHDDLLPLLRDTGCLFITTAVESVDDRVLQIFDKGHSSSDFVIIAERMQALGLTLNPTFVSFTPWTTQKGYLDFLATIDNLGLVENVSPIQYAIRLLLPSKSKLLNHVEVQPYLTPYDPESLIYPWSHPEPVVDALYERVFKLVKGGQAAGDTRRILFERIWETACQTLPANQIPERLAPVLAWQAPTLSEDWY